MNVERLLQAYGMRLIADNDAEATMLTDEFGDGVCHAILIRAANGELDVIVEDDNGEARQK